LINKPKSQEGASRQFWAVLAMYRRDFAGGGSFGWDWPTFRINSPALYTRARALQTIYPTLPRRNVHATEA
jgi:hypothetical protein